MNREYNLKKHGALLTAWRRFAIFLLVFALLASVIYINPAADNSVYAAEPITPVESYNTGTPIILQYPGTETSVVIPTVGKDGDPSNSATYNWFIKVDGQETKATTPDTGIIGPESAYIDTNGMKESITITGLLNLGTDTTHEVVIRPADTDPAAGWGKAMGTGTHSPTAATVRITAVTQDPDIAYMATATDTGNYFRYGQYYGCSSLTTAPVESLPAGVTTIGGHFRSYQYEKCTSLATAPDENIPAGVTSIGEYFRQLQYGECTSLATAAAESLPAGVTEIGDYFRDDQYYRCSSLTAAPAESLPAGVTSIGTNFRRLQYRECSSLATAAAESLPAGVTSIGDRFRYEQYRYCTSLISAGVENIPAGVTSIGEYFRYSQYENCSSLIVAAAESLPAGVTSIGDHFRYYQYENCTSLIAAAAENIPAGVTSIGTYFRYSQYQNCTSLEAAAAESLPAGITGINYYFRAYQYQNCSSLTTAAAESLPAGVITIGPYFRPYQYENCTSLTTAAAEVLPASVSSISACFRYHQYENCTSLTTAATFAGMVAENPTYRESQYAGTTSLSVNGVKITRDGKEVTKVYVGDTLSVGNLLFPITKTWSDNATKVWDENDIVWTHGGGSTATGSAYTVQAGDVGQAISVTLTSVGSPPHSWYNPGSPLISNTIAGADVVNDAPYTVAVSPSPSHGQITPDTDKAVSGETVTISVLPDAGYTANTSGLTVTKAGGGIVSTSGAGNGHFTFTMPDANVTISGVTFSPKSYNLTLDNSVQHGTVAISGGTGTKATGTNVTINATPAAGYTTGWLYYYDASDPSNKTYLSNGVNSISFNMPAFNIKVGATFTPVSQSIATDSITGGTVSLSPSTRTTAPTGATVKLTIAPDSGKKIASLYYKETSSPGNITQLNVNARSFVMPVYGVTVGATFETIAADVPNITTQPQGYSKGIASDATPLSVSASVTDAGILSYQWYKSSSCGTDVSEATPVGDDSAGYTPEKILGTTYYFVVVTNTNNGDTSQTVSGLASVTWQSNNAEISSYFLGGVTDGTPGTPGAVYTDAIAGSVTLTNAQANTANFTATPIDGATLKYAYTATDSTPTFAKWTAQNVANNSYVWIQATSSDGNTVNIYKIKVTLISNAATIKSFTLSKVKTGSRGTPGATWSDGGIVAGSVALTSVQANPASTFTAVKTDSASTLSYAYTADGTTEPTFGAWPGANIADDGYVWIKVQNGLATLIYKIKVTVSSIIIALDANTGAPGTPQAAVATYDSVLTDLDLAGFTPPTKADHIFGGFAVNSDGTGGLIYDALGKAKANVSGYTDSGKKWTNPDSTLTLYAKWIENIPVTITYAAGTGGTVSTPSESVLSATGTAAGATATADEGYTFANWSVTAGVNTTTVLTNANILPLKDGEIYTAVSYTANFTKLPPEVDPPKVDPPVLPNLPPKTDPPVFPNVTAVRSPLKALYLAKGKTFTPSVAFDGKDADGKVWGYGQTAKLNWKSSKTSVATVNAATGKITAKKVGTATITATSLNGKAKITFTVKVVKKALKLKKVALTKPPKSLIKGKTAVLKVKLTSAKATGIKVTFKSSKPSVLKVDKAGKLYAVAKGTAKITVKVGGKSKVITVTVK